MTKILNTTSCHCGAVSIELTRRARMFTSCNCSICRRYGAIWVYFQRKSINIISKKGALDFYTWGQKNLEFFRCKACGCVTHYERTSKRSDGSDMAAVNIRNIDDPSLVSKLPIRLLDGAGSWKVLDRRPQPGLFGSANT